MGRAELQATTLDMDHFSQRSINVTTLSRLLAQVEWNAPMHFLMIIENSPKARPAGGVSAGRPSGHGRREEDDLTKCSGCQRPEWIGRILPKWPPPKP